MTWKHSVLAATITTTVVLGSLAVVARTRPAAASSERSPQPDDPVAYEVRELRLSLERAASQSIQVSAIVMRADASQTRLSYLNSELGNVRAQLARVSADMAGARVQLEQSQRPYPSTPGETTAPRSEMEARGQLEGLTQLAETLRATETRLRSDISREQSAWNALASRLEGLERSPAKGRD